MLRENASVMAPSIEYIYRNAGFCDICLYVSFSDFKKPLNRINFNFELRIDLLINRKSTSYFQNYDIDRSR